METGEILSDIVYVPKAIRNDKGEMITSGSFNTTGRYAKTAEMTDFDTKDVQTGIIRTTQNDARFNIETITLGGKEFYTPVKGTAGGELNFYLIGKEDYREILEQIPGTNKARILLEVRDDAKFRGIYELMPIPRDEFERRKPKEEQPIPEKENPGQFSPKDDSAPSDDEWITTNLIETDPVNFH